MTELFNHMYDLWSQTCEPTTDTYGYSWIRLTRVYEPSAILSGSVH